MKIVNYKNTNYTRFGSIEFIKYHSFDKMVKENGTYIMKTKGKKRMRKTEFSTIAMSFDIETTRKGENSYMYIWQVGLLSNLGQFVIKGRTWDEFRFFLNEINKGLKNKHILCYVHNLPYEFMFLLGEFGADMTNLFAKETWKPLKFNINNVEFRCSYELSNTSLSKLARDYTNCVKIEGDAFNYDKERSCKTELSELEELYCDFDVIILNQYFHNHVLKFLYDDFKIPLTATGIVRNLVVKECIEQYKERHPNKTKFVKKNAFAGCRDTFPSEALYRMMIRYCFMGGSTGAPTSIIGTEFYNVDSYDYTSDYPHKMLCDRYYYPSKWRLSKIKTLEEMEKVRKEKCCMFIIEFYEYEAITPYAYTSKYKIMNTPTSILCANGKVRKADAIRLMITDIDYEIIKRFYKWEDYKILACYTAYKTPTPKYLRDVVAKFYTSKAIKKRNGENYNYDKAVVNSSYGLTVQKLIEKSIEFNGSGFQFAEADSFEIQVAGRCLNPNFGLYITAWARYELWMTIYNCLDDGKPTVYYFDTDSVKGNFTQKGIDYINEYNERCIKENKEMCEKYGYDYSIFYDLGCFDHETKKGKYERFKTLGAKRYIYVQNGEFHQTVAGLGKTAMIEQYKTIDDCFENFNDMMQVVMSQKMRSIRKVEPIADIIDGEMMQANSCLTLMPVEFTLKLEELYKLLVASNIKYDGKEKRIIC